MIKVVEILEVNLKHIICRLSNNDMKKVNLKPLITNHKHLNGIEKLNDSERTTTVIEDSANLKELKK